MPKYQDNSFEEMSLVVLLMIAVFGVILPSVDVYSDILFDVTLFRGDYYHNQWCEENRPNVKVTRHPVFGLIALIPLLASFLASTRLWWQLEQGWKSKLKTLPALLLQFYPQWRVLLVIYHAKWTKNPIWVKMKEEWDAEIGHLGKVTTKCP